VAASTPSTSLLTSATASGLVGVGRCLTTRPHASAAPPQRFTDVERWRGGHAPPRLRRRRSRWPPDRGPNLPRSSPAAQAAAISMHCDLEQLKRSRAAQAISSSSDGGDLDGLCDALLQIEIPAAQTAAISMAFATHCSKSRSPQLRRRRSRWPLRRTAPNRGPPARRRASHCSRRASARAGRPTTP